MALELVLAIALPSVYLVISTAVLAARHPQLPRFLQRLTSRDALLWNTVVGLSIGVGALRWALSR